MPGRHYLDDQEAVSRRVGKYLAATAATIFVVLLLGAPARASLGSLETARITTSGTMSTIPSTWNPHLPKLVTNGEWSYASFFETGAGVNNAWIYKRSESSGWGAAVRTINYPRQNPGLALDTQDRLHVVFNCAQGGLLCVTGGVSSGTWDRFYDVIFNTHNPDGSVYLDDPPAYANYNEFAGQNLGYMAIGTDPSGSRTYASLINDWHEPINPPCSPPPAQPPTQEDFEQKFFELGQDPMVAESHQVPKQFPPSDLVYPQIAVSPTGERYYAVAELFSPCWKTDSDYKGVALYRVDPDGFPATAAFSDQVPEPVGYPDHWAFPSDMSFAPDGRLYFLYWKKPDDINGNCSYLVKETAAGSGTFTDPQPVGCTNHNWAQLQIDSDGRLYIVEELQQTRMLEVRQSNDDGNTWTTQTFTIPRAGNALPSGSTAISGTTLVKPWSSPGGYDPDLLHGVVANRNAAAASWSMVEFRIPINP